MIRTSFPSILPQPLLGVALLVAAAQAPAAIIYKDVTTTDFNTVANWSTANGAATPDPTSIGTTDTLRFNEYFAPSSGTMYTSTLSANIAVGAIRLDSGSGNGGANTGNVTIGGAFTLTLNANTDYTTALPAGFTSTSIVLNSSTGGNLTFAPALTLSLGNDQAWVTSRNLTVNGAINLNARALGMNTVGGTTTLAGVISGTGSIYRSGSATTVISGTDNSFSGQVTLVGGTTEIKKLAVIGQNSSFGTGSIASSLILSGSVLRYSGSGGDTTNRSIDMRAGATISNEGGAGAITFSAASVTQGGTASARTLTLGGANTAANTLASALGDSGTGVNLTSLTKSGAGTWILSGANTYSGVTTVSAGTLRFANRSSLYNGTTARWTAANLVVSSGAVASFAVGGAGEFTTADIDIIDGLGFASGSQIGFDTANAGGAFEHSGAIANLGANTLGVVKSGAGTLTLSGANSYTGNTNVTAGTLAYTGGSNIGGTITVSSGATARFSGNNTISGLTLNGGSSAVSVISGTLTAGALASNVASGSAWNIASGATVSATTFSNAWNPASFTVDGTLNLSGTGANAWSQSTNAAMTIAGAGTVNLAGGYTNTNSTGTVTTFAISRFNIRGGTGAIGFTRSTGTIILGSSTAATTIGIFGQDWSSAAPLSLGTAGATFDTLDSADGTTARTITLTGGLSNHTSTPARSPRPARAPCRWVPPAPTRA